jgi:hypothetical protein
MQPHTRCGSTVIWGIQPSVRTPSSLPGVVADAYAEVAPLARLTVTTSEWDGRTLWAYDDPSGGVVYPDADAMTTVGLTDTPALVHQHPSAGPSAGAALRRIVLRDIGRDLGVTLQAAGGHLTAADKAAVKAACTQATSRAPSSRAQTRTSVAPIANAPAAAHADASATPSRVAHVDGPTIALSIDMVVVGALVVAAGCATGPLRKLSGRLPRLHLPRLRRRPSKADTGK